MKFVNRILLALAVSLFSLPAPGSPFGNTLSFNGLNQTVIVPNFGNIIPTNEVTVEFWAFDTDDTIQQSAFMLAPDDGANRFQAHINYFNGNNYWDFGDIGGAGRIFAPSPPNSISNWVHYALVASQSGNYMRMYVNGQIYASQSGMTPFVRGSYELRIGGTTGYFLKGRLDEFSVWNTALSQAQIQASLNTPLTGSEPNLLVYYRFDSASGAVATNSATATGAAYNGSLANNPAWVASTVLVPGPVVTLPATGVVYPNATLNGSVQNFGEPMSGYFQWGPTTNYGNATPAAALVGTNAANNTLTFSTGLTGLASAVYHYRVVITTGAGVFTGQDVKFWPLAVVLNGANPLTNECHMSFTEPGATANAWPVSVASGFNHFLALRPDGSVVAWGGNAYGQLNVPASLSALALAVGNFDSLAIRADRTVVGWGRDDKGQASGAAGVVNAIAIAMGGYHGVAARTDGTVFAWGDTTYQQAPAPASATNVIAVAAGDYHTLALRTNGTVVAWGAGKVNNPPSFIDYGQSLVPVDATNIVAIAAATYHSLALRANGKVYCWGDNTYGQTNVPASATNVVAIAAGGYHDLALRADGTVVAWGDNSQGQTSVPASATNIVAITAGGYQSFAQRADGVWIGWGPQTALPAVVTNLTQTVNISGSVNTNSPGNYLLTYILTNSQTAATNTRVVVVADRTGPVLTLNGANPFFLALNGSYTEPGYTALDTCQGSLGAADVIVSGTVNPNMAGSNILTYTVTDVSGNATVKQRTVLVVTKPAILAVAVQVTDTNFATGTRTVTASATVNPNGLPGNCVFQYGLNTNYAASSLAAPFAASFTPVNPAQAISNLLPGVTYHLRAVATNTSGLATNDDYAFFIPASYQSGDLNGDGRVDQNELNLVFSNYQAGSPWLYMTNVAGLGGTNITFQFTNSTAGNYSVQYSTNSLTWYNLGPATPQFIFTDTNATGQPLRFYRLFWP